MKYIKQIIFVTLLLFVNIHYVYAESCDTNDINRLKKLARKVEITYEQDVHTYHDDEYNVDVTVYNSYIISIKGLTEEIYGVETAFYNKFLYSNAKEEIVSINGFGSGKKTIEIRSTNCSDKTLYTKKIILPKYNEYANDELCEGISGDDLAVCDEWYTGTLNHEILEKKVTEYKKSLENNHETTEQANSFTAKVNKVFKFLTDNYIYIIISVIIVVVVTTIIILTKRKRSELK